MPERRYRVLFVASHPVQYQAPLFRRLAARPEIDMHVAYCSLRGAEAALDPDFETVVQWDVPLLAGYSWCQVPNKGFGTESFMGLYNPGVWKLIQDGNYDAVISYTGYVRATFWIARLAARRARAAFLFGTDATTLAPRGGQRWKEAVKKIAWPKLFRLADQVIVPSSGTMELMLSLGLPRERISLTPYTVDNDWWINQSRSSDRCALRRSWGAGPRDLVFLFCGKLQGWKRPMDLLKAFAKAKVADAVLVFAGEGALKSQLESEAKTLGLGERVRFLGFANQSILPAIYTSSDVLVLPSEYEPFGVVVNEAMCCGCAVIASDRVGAAKDLIAPIQRDFIYPCGDIEALARLLQADRALFDSAKRAGFDHIRTWSPERNISATVIAIQTAIERVRAL